MESCRNLVDFLFLAPPVTVPLLLRMCIPRDLTFNVVPLDG